MLNLLAAQAMLRTGSVLDAGEQRGRAPPALPSGSAAQPAFAAAATGTSARRRRLPACPDARRAAGRVFARLAARVSEGEVGFGEVAGGTPVSVRQQAIRGLAQVMRDPAGGAPAAWRFAEAWRVHARRLPACSAASPAARADPCKGLVVGGTAAGRRPQPSWACTFRSWPAASPSLVVFLSQLAFPRPAAQSARCLRSTTHQRWRTPPRPAQVALAKGDRHQAALFYEELVAKALMGRGTAEHWAYAGTSPVDDRCDRLAPSTSSTATGFAPPVTHPHRELRSALPRARPAHPRAEYGWLLFGEGKADGARVHLETALDMLARLGLAGQEAAAEYHYKLGRRARTPALLTRPHAAAPAER